MSYTFIKLKIINYYYYQVIYINYRIMAPIELFIKKCGLLLICIIIAIIIILCLCKFTNSLSAQSNIDRNNHLYHTRSIELRRQIVEYELNIINEQLEIVSTLKDYLHNLHNPQIINDENVVIIVGPDNKTMHLGAKIDN